VASATTNYDLAVTSSPPSRSTLRLRWRIHKLVWRLSGGRLGRKVGGLPVLELTTTGRKSGEPRMILIWHITDSGGPIIAGTNAGADYDPAQVLHQRHLKYVSAPTDSRSHAPARLDPGSYPHRGRTDPTRPRGMHLLSQLPVVRNRASEIGRRPITHCHRARRPPHRHDSGGSQPVPLIRPAVS
jgi:F420H(2)-dependent quinone reductase